MEDFVRDHLLPQDRVAVMAWNRTTELSTDRSAIIAVLEAFRKSHEKIERDLTEWFRDLRGQYGSREMPEHIQKQIDAVFAASTLRTRTRVDGPGGESGMTAELRKTQDALDRAATAEGRPEGTSLMSAMDAALLVGAEGSLNQFVSRNITMAQDLANLRAAIDYLRYLDGEKHVIFITETGLLASSITGNGSIAAAANNARVVVDTIQSGGVSGEGLPSAATGSVLNPVTGGATAPPPPPMTFNPGFAAKTINLLARDTGGVSTVYRYGADAIKRIDSATRFGYLIGYYSSNQNYDKRYRNVAVTVNRPGVEVLYRHGYYATAASVALNSKDMADYSRMSRAAMSDTDVLDLPLSFTTHTAGAAAAVTVDLNVRIDKLAPVETPQGKQYSLELAVFCANGKKIVGQLSKRLEVTLNPALHAKMLAGGLTASVSVPVSAPATVVKVIVLDTATDSLGSVMKAIK
jgi:VWFA-related protein